jgi:type IV secretion system protein VirB9
MIRHLAPLPCLLLATTLHAQTAAHSVPPATTPGTTTPGTTAPVQAAPVPETLPAAVRPAPRRSYRLPRAAGRVADANRTATREPVTAGYLGAVQVYPYAEGTLFRIFAAPERVTDIALQPGEALVAIAAGDTTRWTVGDTSSGSGDAKRTHVLLKPFSAGLATNLVITTDRRSYHLELASTPATAMAAVSWTYPADALIALKREVAATEAARPIAAGVPLEALRFNYRISGDAPVWRPLRAFDDGRQTFIEFPAGIAQDEAPPLFVIGTDSAAELVNYRVAGRFYIVDRLFNAAELRLGAKKQQIVRIARDDGRKHRGGRHD